MKMSRFAFFSLQIDALQEVLEKLRSKEMPLEKKHGWLPSVCNMKCITWEWVTFNIFFFFITF